MPSESYWTRVMRKRMTRRRALAGTAAAGFSAAFLAACGGDDDAPAPGATMPPGATPSPATTPEQAGLLHTPSSSTSQARPGGTLRHYDIGDATHFDAVADPAATVVRHSSTPFYPRLLRMDSVTYPDVPDGSSSGEVAEEFEVSPDRLTVTLKLRQNMLWDYREPTNNRPIDAEDVVFSWNKYRALNPNAPALAYDPGDAGGGPIESIEAVDDSTIVVRLHEPYAEIVPLLSANDLLYIAPRESDGGFDPRTTVRAHGMYLLDEYIPGASFRWVKNPDFYIQGRPFPDVVEVPILPDYSGRLAQFRAGHIYTDVVLTTQDDVIHTKQDVTETLLLQESLYPITTTNMIQFGWEEGTPWRDTRVRQAISMMIDREGFIDVVDNRDNFRRDGLEVDVRQNSVVTGGWEGYWLDPTNEPEFGASAKYLNLNLEEATKLLRAAGQENIEFDLNIGGHYGAAYNRISELYEGMLRAGGLRPQIRSITPAGTWLSDYSRVYRTTTYQPGAGFTGLAVVPERQYVTAPVQLINQWHRNGGGYRGALVDGGDIRDGDPRLNDLTERIIQEFDRDAQVDLVHELIRYATERSYYIPRPSSAKGFSVWWPAVGNAGAYISPPNSGAWTDQRLNWWVDTTKAPLA